MTRRHLSAKHRLQIFQSHNGTCHICACKIQVGEKWEVEHVIPIAQGGDDDEANMRPAHVKCHREKTKKDAKDTAKAKRLEQRHLGIPKQTRQPLPFGRYSKFKKKISGEVVLR